MANYVGDVVAPAAPVDNVDAATPEVKVPLGPSIVFGYVSFC